MVAPIRGVIGKVTANDENNSLIQILAKDSKTACQNGNWQHLGSVGKRINDHTMNAISCLPPQR